MVSEHYKNKRGCFIMVVFALVILAIAAWFSFGMHSNRETSPAAANLSAPGDATTGS
jgi:hypothetical protein